MNNEFDPMESFGYKSGIFSLEEGQLEVVVDKIKTAETTIEAMCILGRFLDNEKLNNDNINNLDKPSNS